MSANNALIISEFSLNVVNNDKITIYAFEDYRLDALRMMLYRGEKEVSLPPKSIKTLLVLVKNQGEILSKEDLIAQIWQDTVVEESNLAHHLSVLRKTLGNTRDGKPFIETFPRRGYRFNGEARLLETTRTENGSVPPTEYLSIAPRRDVERHGNVLKVVDWREAEKQAAEMPTVEASAAASPTPKYPLRKTAMLAAAALTIIVITAIFFLRSRVAPPSQAVTNAKNELTILQLTNGGAPVDATISPDGKYFAYHEVDGGTTHLWLQQTGQNNRLEIIPPWQKPIGGKTFSPDGQFLYFVAQDKWGALNWLYRVPALGGVPSKILGDLNSPVSFSPDGSEMVFERWNEQTGTSALIIAPATGGEERILLQRTAKQGIFGCPAWSPNGKLIAFSTQNLQDSQYGGFTISAINLQTGEVATLSPEKWDICVRMVWTPDGQGLVFIGTKAGDGYTARRDQIYYLSYPSGEARRLTADGSRYALLSLGITDKNEIVALPYNRLSQIWQMDANGDARTAVQLTRGMADGRAGLAPLPDGRIGYITRTGDNLNVCVANRDGTDQKQIVNDLQAVEELRASPDGRFFVFAAQRDGFNHLFLMDADGANLQQLTSGNSYNIDSTVSPDGNWLVYDSIVIKDGERFCSLWRVSTSGGDPTLLTDKGYATPHFSPNGKYISCVYKEKEIIILSAENGSVVQTFDTSNNPQLNFGARWSPDGQAVIYIVHEKNCSNLWLQPINGSVARPLTNFSSGIIHNFAFSSDGSRLYVARGYPIQNVVLIKNFR